MYKGQVTVNLRLFQKRHWVSLPVRGHRSPARPEERPGHPRQGFALRCLLPALGLQHWLPCVPVHRGSGKHLGTGLRSNPTRCWVLVINREALPGWGLKSCHQGLAGEAELPAYCCPPLSNSQGCDLWDPTYYTAMISRQEEAELPQVSTCSLLLFVRSPVGLPSLVHKVLQSPGD